MREFPAVLPARKGSYHPCFFKVSDQCGSLFLPLTALKSSSLGVQMGDRNRGPRQTDRLTDRAPPGATKEAPLRVRGAGWSLQETDAVTGSSPAQLTLGSCAGASSVWAHTCFTVF